MFYFISTLMFNHSFVHFTVVYSVSWPMNVSCDLVFTVFAFDEEEHILIVSLLPQSLSRVLWTSTVGIDRDAMRFQHLGVIFTPG